MPWWNFRISSTPQEGKVISIIVIGIDLAKFILAVHSVNEAGKAELVKPRVSREQLLPLIASLPPCLIGMEACIGAHHWARQFRQHGHITKAGDPYLRSLLVLGARAVLNSIGDK